jgi:hypothetical protein
MAVSLSVIAAKDSAGTAIAGGLQAQDKSGVGTGPFTLGQVLIDGLAGINMAAVTAANAVKVDGSAVTQPVSIAAAQTLATVTTVGAVTAITNALPAGTNLLGKADIQIAGTAPDVGSGTGGTKTLRTILDTASPGIIATGTQAAPSASYLSTVAAGDIAAAATDSGNPVKIGGVGKTANPSAVTDGQRVNSMFDKIGKQVVVGGLRELKVEAVLTLTASTTETTLLAAVASTFLDLYLLAIENTSATATEVIIRDATAGGKARAFMVPAGETRGFALSMDSAIPQGAVNNNWTAQCTTSVTSVKITALFVKNL